MEGWMLNREKETWYSFTINGEYGLELSFVQGGCLLLETAVIRNLSNISAWTTVMFRWHPYGPCVTGQLLPLFLWTCLWPPSQKWYKSSMIYPEYKWHMSSHSNIITQHFFLSTEWKSPEHLNTNHSYIRKYFHNLFYTVLLIKPWHA